MFKTDTFGKKFIIILHYYYSLLLFIIIIHLKDVVPPVGCLKLDSAEKCGVEIPKKNIGLPKNRLFHRWSQLTNIIDAIQSYEISDI